VSVSKEITRLEHSRVKLSLTVGKEKVNSEYDKILKDYCKNVQIPGFRKGKAPRNVLERKFGNALLAEIAGRLAEQALEDVFKDESFPKENLPLAYSTPVFDGDPAPVKLDEDYTFTVAYDVFPQFKVEAYKGLEIEIPEVSVTDADVGCELEAIRERNAVVFDKAEESPAVEGDVATVNYSELNAEGGVEKGTERQDFVFTIGSGHSFFKFDSDIIGMKKGDSKDIEKAYPEDFEHKDLAGKTKKIRVSLTALKEKKLPVLDDEFAQDVDEKYKTLDDLKKNIREKLEQTLERKLIDLKINKIVEKIMEKTPVDIPESMIRIQLDAQWRNFAHQINMTVERLKADVEKSQGGLASFEELWRPEAEKILHSRLVIETLMRDLSLDAAEADIEKELSRQAEQSGTSPEEIKKLYAQDNMKDYLTEEIKERKLFDILLTENTIKLVGKEEFARISQTAGERM
jgi:trigger factor